MRGGGGRGPGAAAHPRPRTHLAEQRPLPARRRRLHGHGPAARTAVQSLRRWTATPAGRTPLPPRAGRPGGQQPMGGAQAHFPRPPSGSDESASAGGLQFPACPAAEARHGRSATRARAPPRAPAPPRGGGGSPRSLRGGRGPAGPASAGRWDHGKRYRAPQGERARLRGKAAAGAGGAAGAAPAACRAALAAAGARGAPPATRPPPHLHASSQPPSTALEEQESIINEIRNHPQNTLFKGKIVQ